MRWLFGRKKTNPKRRRGLISLEYHAAKTRVWAINDKLDDKRTTPHQRALLEDALPKAEARVNQLRVELDKALVDEYEEDVRRLVEDERGRVE